MSNLQGQKFADYEVVAKLGEGGFGVVYKAKQPVLNRFVALKTMAAHLSRDKEFVARFQREAASAATLNHPNVVGVYTAGEAHGTHYLVMEFVEGESLRRRLDRDGRIEPREALAITICLAQALQHAWNEARLIHRDVKPDNVFLSTKGTVKLGDLGLAKSVGGNTTDTTVSGMILGSPHYISPEQARGIKELDFRADIYSLGCTLYHMLSGWTPYRANETLALVLKHLNDPIPDLQAVMPDCPPALAALVSRMMAKDRDARHQSYDELIAELTVVRDKIAPAQTAPEAPPSGTITFLFTDIEGSTQLWEQHPAAMPTALEQHSRILRRAVESHGGFVFKTVGDAFCVAFASAPNALAAALAAQRALAAEPWGETGPLRVRMALHTDVAEARGGDYFGPPLNRVARVLAAGHGGQILLSNATEQLVRDHLPQGVSLSDLGERSLKNLTRAEHIYQINVTDLPAQFPTLRSVASHSAAYRRRRMMIYGSAAAAAVAAFAGLLLWSPWRAREAASGERQAGEAPQRLATQSQPHAREAASATPVAERASVRTEAADRTLARSATVSSAVALKLPGKAHVNSFGVEMAYIPAGKFMMGSEKGNPDELPVHEEIIAKPFYMSIYEVTQEQWERVIGTKYPNRSFHREAGMKRLPVEFVSLAKARDFCAVLTAKENRPYRLPTEAEWEYACRAGSTTEFCSGNSRTDLSEVGWSAENSASQTHEVGTRKPNAWSLYDMHGNVWEWCETRYFSRYDRRLFGSGTWVARGGSAYNPAQDCRSAKRMALENISQRKEVGFRVVAEIK